MKKEIKSVSLLINLNGKKRKPSSMPKEKKNVPSLKPISVETKLSSSAL
jgi:hypothetical protein